MDCQASKEDRLARLESAEARLKELQSAAKPWPNGMTAEEMIADAKEWHFESDVED